MIILYGSNLSTYTTKVRLALRLRGIAFEQRLPEGGYRSTAWRAQLPTGTVPAIDHDGFFLAESEAILEYLEDVFAQHPLRPNAAQQRARARWIARLHDTQFEPRLRAIFPLVRDPSRRAELTLLRADLQDRLDRIAAVVSSQPWMAGADFSLADCGFAVSLPLAERILDTLGQPLQWPHALKPWREAWQEYDALHAALFEWRQAVDDWLAPTES
ncbi:MAG: glutathione S-transferase family protein [Burkholderiales bacterium]